MSEQHNADNQQSSAQHNEPILVNAQGQPHFSDEDHQFTKTNDSSAKRSKTKADREQQPVSYASPVVIKSGKGLAAGALVLSILALGASGFLFVEGQNQLKLQQLAYEQKIDAAGIGASKTALTLQTSLARVDEVTRQLQVVQQQQQNHNNQLTKLDNAYQQLVKNRTDWLVDEVEATLNMAAQQLIISGNVPIAISVLEDLDSRLARFDQPQLLPIKKAISGDLEDLKSKPYLDIASASLRLNRLEASVTSLPLIVDDQLQPGVKNMAIDEGEHLKWWQRTWYYTIHALQDMVEVRRVDNSDSMLISPQQIFFVRENLRLKLMDARLALMQRSGEIYSADLNSVEVAVKQYFDGHSATTQSWLKELAQLKSLNVQSSRDANILTNSLMAVSQYQKQNGMDTSIALSASDTMDAASASMTQTPAPVGEAKSASEPDKSNKPAHQLSIQAMGSEFKVRQYSRV